jgi:soluble P-type ATPase
MANLNLSVVVLDYDGTIADNGVLHPEVRAAIAELRASGFTLVAARCHRRGRRGTADADDRRGRVAGAQS